MSVINKMLQDLDARGLQAARSGFSNVRSVPGETRRLEVQALIALGVLAVVALAGLGIWRFTTAPVPPVAADQAPVLLAAVVLEKSPQASAPASEVVTLAPLVPAVPVIPVAAVSSVPAVPETKLAAAPIRRSAPAAVHVAQQSRNKPKQPEGVAGHALQMKQSSPRQEAENEYRHALALVQDGRVTAGISALEQTLRLFPRHEAARQTLIGLLLESWRADEAMQQLEQGLALDPAQTALAMTLARLQVERNGAALQTLQRSLPHAQDNAEYQGFIAALLQREQRHKEAVEHYTSALRMNPGNGIWWMGLGISLQADQRLPDARMAFQKAKASGTLDGELSNFVDKKLQQLAR